MTAATSLAPSRAYEPALDGLRAVSILFVVVRHLEITTLVSANLGVTIFFFVSGFIITRLMLAERAATGRLDIVRFWLRRLVRLAPALYLMIAAITAFAWWRGLAIDPGQILAGLLYYMNYYSIMLRDSGLAYTLPINPLWSLAVEEHFYLVFPLLFLALAGRPDRFAALLLALTAGILLWRYINILALDFTPKYNYFASESRVDTILFGCLLSITAWRAAAGDAGAARLVGLLRNPAAGLAAGAALLASVFVAGEVFQHTARYTLQGCLLFLAVGAILFSPGLGRISYSLYLWHLPVATMLAETLGREAPGFKWLALAASVGVAALSYGWVERPLVARFSPRPRG